MKIFPLSILLCFSLTFGFAQGDPCFNGGFEDNLNGYNGESGIFGNQATSCELDQVNFFSSSNFPGGVDFVLEQDGNLDPNVTVTEIRTVHDGDQSVRINDAHVGFNIDKLTKTFTVPSGNGDYSFFFWYALVMENPEGHEDEQPFFEVNVCPASGSCDTPIESLCVVADASNVGTFGVQPRMGSTIVYQDWQCIRIDIPASYAGTDVTVEFTAADCGAGAHWGYVYIDDICVSCESVPVGSITLDPITEPCDENLPITINGSFTLPTVGGLVGSLDPSDLNLAITSNGENVTLGTVSLINFDLSTNTFSFEINESNLGAIGCYDVYVTAVFEFNSEPLPVVTSYSANPNLPGDVDNDFCSSFAECVCTDPTLTLFGGGEAGICLDGSLETITYFGNYTLPAQQPGNILGDIEDISYSLYLSGESSPVVGPINAQVLGSGNYNMAIDLSSLSPGCYDIQVIGNFTCAGETIQSETWLFDHFCYNTPDCQVPTIQIVPIETACVELPLEVCGSYTPPLINGIPGEVTTLSLRVNVPGSSFNITDFQLDEDAQTFCFLIEDHPFFEENPGCYTLRAFGTFNAPEDHTFFASGTTGEEVDFCLNAPECSPCGVTVLEECTPEGNVQLTAIDLDGNPISFQYFLNEFKWSIYANGQGQGTTIHNTNPVVINANSCYKLTYTYWFYSDNVPWQVPSLADSVCTFVTPYTCLDLNCEGPCADFPQFILAGCNDDYSILNELKFPDGNCNDFCDGYGTVGIFNLDGSPLDPTGYTISWANGSTGVFTSGNPYISYLVTIHLTDYPECSWTARYRPKCLCENEPTHLECEQRIIKHCQGDQVYYTQDPLRLTWQPVLGATGYEIAFEFEGLEECCGDAASTPPYTITTSYLNYVDIDDLDCFIARVRATGGLDGCETSDWSEPYEFCLTRAECDTSQVVCGCCGGHENHDQSLHAVQWSEDTHQTTPISSLVDPQQNTLRDRKFAAYPNPVTNELVIDAFPLEEEQLTIEIYDIYKRPMVSLLPSDVKSHKIQLNNWPEGIYILTIRNQFGKILHTDKIFKLK